MVSYVQYCFMIYLAISILWKIFKWSIHRITVRWAVSTLWRGLCCIFMSTFYKTMFSLTTHVHTWALSILWNQPLISNTHTLTMPLTSGLMDAFMKPLLVTMNRVYWKYPAGPQWVWVPLRTRFSWRYRSPYFTCSARRTFTHTHAQTCKALCWVVVGLIKFIVIIYACLPPGEASAISFLRPQWRTRPSACRHRWWRLGCTGECGCLRPSAQGSHNPSKETHAQHLSMQGVTDRDHMHNPPACSGSTMRRSTSSPSKTTLPQVGEYGAGRVPERVPTGFVFSDTVQLI